VHESFRDHLRCPFCGTRLSIVDNDALRRTTDGGVTSGVIGCECCAFPVVDGIPVLIADERTRAAIVSLEAGRGDEAREILLGLDETRAAAFRELQRRGRPSYAALVDVLSPDAEGTYFVYRFSDPTFLLAEAVLTAVADDAATMAGWVLDVCGGSGHLTRVLARLQGEAGPPSPRTVLADVYFWKLWLAREITAPACHAVCCDANQPLPFAPATFSLAVLSDAFPYIWHKRLLADELLRATGPEGVVVLPHLHSADGWNFSQGMALTPGGYAEIFAAGNPRLFRDRDLLDDVLDRGVVDLSAPIVPSAMGTEASVTLVAGRHAEPARAFPLPPPGRVRDRLAVNPLYRVTTDGAGSTLTLTFPTPEYGEEFEACRRYLPDEIRLPATLTAPLDEATLRTTLGDERYRDLRRRRVLLDVPDRY
jgi:SAM-dependent methyltransferase/uncharacterized protein YbaR (Trm112 family)